MLRQLVSPRIWPRPSSIRAFATLAPIPDLDTKPEPDQSDTETDQLDTLQFVEKLELECQFTAAQTEAILTCMMEVITLKSTTLRTQLADRMKQDRINVSHKVDFAQLKADVKMLERNDFTLLKAENDRMSAELEKLKQKLREDLNRLYASNRLETNMMKGQHWDDASETRSKLSETEAKMEQELGQVRAALGQVKLDTLRTVLTTASTVGLILLGFLRLFK